MEAKAKIDSNPEVSFQIKCDSTKFGENVYVTGNLKSLGNWNPENSLKLLTNDENFPLWKSNPQRIDCSDECFEYKYIIKGNNSTKWETFQGNRVVYIKDITDREKAITLIDENYGVNKKPKILHGEKTNHINQINNVESSVELERKEYQEEIKHKKFEYTEFIISEKLKNMIDTFVKLNEEKKTWKEKLSLVWETLPNEGINQTESKESAPEKELLALISVYLYFINSGQIKCREDGTHFRPNHHSSLAHSIFTYLSQIQSDENSIITRSILKNLPSFSDQYMVSVPLTRIRDIAHRNDIPHELKQEIKATLQNKLHRSASPDDLKTCERILGKITAPGTNYSRDFISEFKIFYEELKEFFNALGLEKVLLKVKDLIPEEYGNARSEIDKMLQIKNEPTDRSISKLEHIMKLRATLAEIVKDGLNNSNKSINKTLIQNSSTGEIELENFSYVVLSEYIDKTYYSSNNISEDGYKMLIHLLNVCLDGLKISSIKSKECQLIKEDLQNFTKLFNFTIKETSNPNNRLSVLKVKSVLERCQNLFYEIADDVNRSFTIPAHSLGKALQIQPHSVQVFCESFIRSHPIFQFSKIVSLLISRVRDVLNLPPFVTISSGSSQGYFLHLNKLADFNPNKHQYKEFIVFLDESDGSEEVPNEIKGIILSHDLPQLSHLAIRARQNKVAFVCCLDVNIYKYQYYKHFNGGDFISVSFKSDENIKIEKTDVTRKSGNENESKSKKSESDQTEEESDKNFADEEDGKLEEEITEGSESTLLLPIINATKKNSGSKCANMRELSHIKNEFFETPVSFALPYSIYTKYACSTIKEKDYQSIDKCLFEDIDKNSSILREKFIDTALSEDFAMHVNDLDIIAQQINNSFSHNAPLAIRSSSNLEDLKKSAGAGLFDSYLGIMNSPSKKDEIKHNICNVWASLFTYRGIIARRNNNIPSSLAKMGVLIQQMINPDFSFVIHTVNPINKNSNEVYIEIAIGLGETLASARQRGSPYRLVYNKEDDNVQINNFASFSFKIKNGNDLQRISYKDEILSNDDDYLDNLGRTLGKISLHLEDYFKAPQDVEGGVFEDKIYLMQTRPQIL